MAYYLQASNTVYQEGLRTFELQVCGASQGSYAFSLVFSLVVEFNRDFHHLQTPAFTFISSHDESVWNLDGEIFQACEVSVQACRGLVSLFASGPEV